MKAVIFDIDGTLSDVEHRKKYLPDNWGMFFSEMHKDPVIEPVAWLARELFMRSLKTDEFDVLIVTARPDNYKLKTVEWLGKHGIAYDKIYMRKENDFRQDAIVKAEILQQIIDDGYEPWLVVDDRPQVVEMWREYGITTLQCAPDEPQRMHDGFNFLTMLVGPSGAGKSTWCQDNALPHDVISTDQLREEYGWGHSPEDLNKTWRYAHGLIRTRLENHIFTVLDATNIKRKDRMKVLSMVPKGQWVKYVVIDRDLDDKLRDRGWRPEELILKHHKTFKSQLKDILAGDNQPNVVVEDQRAS